MELIIGLTGGIASGKSTASQYLINKGIPVVDADKIARLVVEKGMPAYESIVAAFGEEVLDRDLSLNRSRLGDIIFQDASKRELLNSIVHPAVRTEMKRQAEEHFLAGNMSVVMDIPLLFESRLTHMVDRTILIYVPQDIQLQRLLARDSLKEEQAKARISSQMPLEEKINLSDAVVKNDGSKEDLYQQLDRVLTEWNIL
ncbi:dephospho-CoA kinase [Fictibacillus iocasae]|uniref:Dephospho-CoA kinase n=1 Tax=Fictibacillus iocasae TaxID=2715437 RepID=A0ABW2NPW9_9BACL